MAGILGDGSVNAAKQFALLCARGTNPVAGAAGRRQRRASISGIASSIHVEMAPASQFSKNYKALAEAGGGSELKVALIQAVTELRNVAAPDIPVSIIDPKSSAVQSGSIGRFVGGALYVLYASGVLDLSDDEIRSARRAYESIVSSRSVEVQAKTPALRDKMRQLWEAVNRFEGRVAPREELIRIGQEVVEAGRARRRRHEMVAEMSVGVASAKGVIIPPSGHDALDALREELEAKHAHDLDELRHAKAREAEERKAANLRRIEAEKQAAERLVAELEEGHARQLKEIERRFLEKEAKRESELRRLREEKMTAAEEEPDDDMLSRAIKTAERTVARRESAAAEQSKRDLRARLAALEEDAARRSAEMEALSLRQQSQIDALLRELRDGGVPSGAETSGVAVASSGEVVRDGAVPMAASTPVPMPAAPVGASGMGGRTVATGMPPLPLPMMPPAWCGMPYMIVPAGADGRPVGMPMAGGSARAPEHGRERRSLSTAAREMLSARGTSARRSSGIRSGGDGGRGHHRELRIIRDSEKLEVILGFTLSAKKYDNLEGVVITSSTASKRNAALLKRLEEKCRDPERMPKFSSSRAKDEYRRCCEEQGIKSDWLGSMDIAGRESPGRTKKVRVKNTDPSTKLEVTMVTLGHGRGDRDIDGRSMAGRRLPRGVVRIHRETLGGNKACVADGAGYGWALSQRRIAVRARDERAILREMEEERRLALFDDDEAAPGTVKVGRNALRDALGRRGHSGFER